MEFCEISCESNNYRQLNFKISKKSRKSGAKNSFNRHVMYTITVYMYLSVIYFQFMAWYL